MPLDSVVIAGAGHAGFQAALSLRQDGFQGRITLFGDEPGLPYQRPPLSKAYLLGKTNAEALRFRPAKFFADHHIGVEHDRIVAIDRTNRRVTLRSGAAASYDHLILAVGAHNRALPVPGADLDGVLGLRTLADAELVRARLEDARDVVVVGAGFIGLEFAAVAAALGRAVHVLELADRPMARALSVETSAFFARAHEGWGVRLDLGQGLARVAGDGGRVTGVETTGGRTLPADLVLVGIGVLPNVQLAAEAALDIENGVRVDAHLATSDPTISAIGDCASFPGAGGDSHVRLESVQNATDQAKTVAARLLGRPAAYAAVPWFWSDQGDLKLQIAGLSTGHDTAVVVGAGERSQSALCFRRGQLVAVESVNRASDHVAARRLLARVPSLRPQDAAAGGFDLKAWEAANR